MDIVGGTEKYNYEDWVKFNTGDNIIINPHFTTVTTLDELNKEFAVISSSQGLLGSVQQSYIAPDMSTGLSKLGILREEIDTKQEPKKIVIHTHTIEYKGKNDEELKTMSSTMNIMKDMVNEVLVKREIERKEDLKRRDDERREDRHTTRIMRRITLIGIIITIVLGVLTYCSNNMSTKKLVNVLNINHQQIMEVLVPEDR